VDNQNGRIKLPKMGWMRYRKSREIAGTPKNVTVSLVNGKAFISIQNEREVETPMHPSKSSVGLDWGIKGFTPCRTASMKSNCHRSNSSL
jgi:putative transposase